jgi:hypothetical protein
MVVRHTSFPALLVSPEPLDSSPVSFLTLTESTRETKFPAYDRKLHGDKKEEYIDDYVTGQNTKTVNKGGEKAPAKKVPNELGQREKNQSLNLQNTFIKFALDSTVGTCINVSSSTSFLYTIQRNRCSILTLSALVEWK